MGLFDTTDLALQAGLRGAAMRQQLLANNLANANTPGYKRSDLDFESSLAAALSSSDPAAALQSVTFHPRTDTSTSLQADGNNVNVDQEMSALTQNAVEYQTLEAVEQSRIQSIRSAIGGA